MEEVTVAITPQGDVQISVKGVKGSGCKALTKGLEEALGTVTKAELTKEYAENAQQRTTRINQSGR